MRYFTVATITSLSRVLMLLLLLVVGTNKVFGVIVTPSATDAMGLVGDCYYDDNIPANGKVSNWTNNWNNGSVVTAATVNPISFGGGVIWVYNNVWLKSGAFKFRKGTDYNTQLALNDFSAINCSYGTSISGTSIPAGSGNINITTTGGASYKQYNIYVFRSSSGSFTLSVQESAGLPLGLIGGVYDNSNTAPNVAIGSTWTENWDGGTATTPYYKVAPTLSSNEYVWNYNNVWMKPASDAGSTSNSAYQFRFRFSDDWANANHIGYTHLGARTSVTDGVGTTAIVDRSSPDNNLGIWNTSGIGRKYNVEVRLKPDGLYYLNITAVTVSLPTTTDALGLFGNNCYYNNNDYNSALINGTEHWDNGTASTTYTVASAVSGSDNTWTFNNVWLSPGSGHKFLFREDADGVPALEYTDFASISKPADVTLANSSGYIEMTTTTNATGLYNLVVTRLSGGTYTLTITFVSKCTPQATDNLGLFGYNSYYDGNNYSSSLINGTEHWDNGTAGATYTVSSVLSGTDNVWSFKDVWISPGAGHTFKFRSDADNAPQLEWSDFTAWDLPSDVTLSNSSGNIQITTTDNLLTRYDIQVSKLGTGGYKLKMVVIERSIPSSTSKLGIFGNCYYDNNDFDYTIVNETEHWDNGSDISTYVVGSVDAGGGDYTWTFSDVWIVPGVGKKFYFREDADNIPRLFYGNFASITKPASVTINQSGNYLEFRNTGDVVSKYDFVVRLTAAGTYTLTVTFKSRPTPRINDKLALIGNCYFQGNDYNGALVNETETWDNGTSLTNYSVYSAPVGADDAWTFTGVWIKPGAGYKFKFREDVDGIPMLEWQDFSSVTPSGGGTALANNSQYIEITNTGNVVAQYNIVVTRYSATGTYGLAVTKIADLPTPPASPKWGFRGTATYLGNNKGGTVGDWAHNWNKGNVVYPDSVRNFKGSDTNYYWHFDNVWLRNGGEFRFINSSGTWLAYGDFGGRIYVPNGLSIGNIGDNFKINSTPSSIDAKCDIILKYNATTTQYSMYIIYTRLALNGNCYYHGNRTDAAACNDWESGSCNRSWRASAGEPYETKFEIESGTFPASKFTYKFFGVKLKNHVANSGVGFLLDQGGWLPYDADVNGTAGTLFNVAQNFNSDGGPNQDLQKVGAIQTDSMYTFVYTIDYSSGATGAAATSIKVDRTTVADWKAYRMGLIGDAYFLENDTTKVADWSINWSKLATPTTFDVAPTISVGTGGMANVTWTFDGVIISDDKSFKLRNGSSWNGINIGYNSVKRYTAADVMDGTVISSDIGTVTDKGGNVSMLNPNLFGTRESKYIYTITLTLETATGRYSFFGVNKATDQWIGGDVTWDGIENVATGWRNPLNWSLGVVPLRSTDVVIDKQPNQPIITSNATCNTLTIANTSGANVTVNAGGVLDVRSIVNSVPSAESGIILNNNVRKQAILYNYGTYTNAAGGGLVKINTTLDKDTTYHLGHEVSGATVKADSYNNTTTSIYRYNTVTNYWDALANGDKLTTADLTPSCKNSPVTGYAIRNRSAGAQVISYSGVPMSNSVDYTINIPFDNTGAVSGYYGYYLVANPYTTYLDIETLYANSGFSANIVQSVWVPHRSGSSATTWEGWNLAAATSLPTAGGRIGTLANRRIPPGQAFWVLTKTNGAPFTFKPIARKIVQGTSQQSLKSLSQSTEPNDIFRFGSNTTGFITSIALVFREIGTVELTTNDTPGFMGLDGIYAIKSGQETSISLLPLLSNDTIIDLGYRYSGSSSSPIVLEPIDLGKFHSDVSVYLEDRQEGMMYDLRETPQISVFLAKGVNTSRFALHFSASQGVVTTFPSVSKPTAFVEMSQYRNSVKVEFTNAPSDVNGAVRVVTLSGEIVSTTRFEGNKGLTVELPNSNQLYMVEVNSSVGRQIQKFRVISR